MILLTALVALACGRAPLASAAPGTHLHHARILAHSIRSYTLPPTRSAGEDSARAAPVDPLDTAWMMGHRVGTVRTTSRDAMERSPEIDVVEAIPVLTRIVESSEAGFSIRGGRPSQTAIRIDGVSMADPVHGSFGPLGASLAPLPPVSAIEDVSVWSAGADPRVIDLTPSVVEIRTRRGDATAWHLEARFVTDVGALDGWSDPLTVKLAGEKRDTTLPEAKGASRGRRSYEISAGGPLPFADGLTLAVSGRLTTFDHLGATYDVYDMSDEYARNRAPIAEQLWGKALDPTNLGQLPHQGAAVRYLGGRLHWSIGERTSLDVIGSYGSTSSEMIPGARSYTEMVVPTAWRALYMDDVSTVTGALERDAEQPVVDMAITRISAAYATSLGRGGDLRLSVSNVGYDYRVGARDESKSHGPFSRYDINWIDNADGDIYFDRYQRGDVVVGRPDPNSEDELPIIQRNRVTGLYEGPPTPGASHNPFGLRNDFFPAHGTLAYLEARQVSELDLRGSYGIDVPVGQKLVRLEGGAEYRRTTLRRTYFPKPYDAPFDYDIYGFDEGSFLPSDEDIVGDYRLRAHVPTVIGGYVQLIYRTPGIDLQLGVRGDLFDPDGKYVPGGISDNLPKSILDSLPMADARFLLSPRAGFAMLVGRRSRFYGNVALVNQLPELTYITDNQIVRVRERRGDPRVGAEQAVTAELGWWSALTRELDFDAVGYYRGISHRLVATGGAIGGPASSTDMYDVADSGKGLILGLDLSLTRRLSNNLEFTVGYGVMHAFITPRLVSLGTDPFGAGPSGGVITKGLRQDGNYAVAGDRAHSIWAQVGMAWGDGEGPAIGGVRFMERGAVTLRGRFATGLPYSLMALNGTFRDEYYNGSRLPNLIESALHLEKCFRLDAWLGSSMGEAELGIFADVENLLNLTGPLGARLTGPPVNPDGSLVSLTGDADLDTLLDIGAGGIDDAVYYRSSDPDRPETFGGGQYDPFGHRLYNPYADVNLDGVVTQRERVAGYQRFVATQQSLRTTYQRPRSVSVGVTVRF